MCGIAGFWRNRPLESRDLATLERMTDVLAHRGPDGRGVWTDEPVGLGLGHRRLAIQDLSAAGHQPMVSHDGRFVLSYNGEIYNAGDVRRDLAAKGVAFRGHSDTEVFVEAVSAWGLEPALERLAGMFAAALWDRETRKLYLVRDRIGIKPLYWGLVGGTFAFGSELKALHCLPDFVQGIDRDALSDYARYGVVHAPRSIFKDIFKLKPGCVLVYDGKGGPQISSYWHLPTAPPVADRARQAALTDELVHRLETAAGEHLLSDVPVGAFLSGGIDSSLVTALSGRHAAPQKINSFTVAFSESAYDESRAARDIAEHLGTDHLQTDSTPAAARALLDDLPLYYDEPFADSSQLPTLLISKFIREHVTVALSGDGGDELFAGYPRYGWAMRLGSRVPRPLRWPAARLIEAGAALLPRSSRWQDKRTRARRLAELVALGDPLRIHDNLLAVSRQDLVRGGGQRAAPDLGYTGAGIRAMQIRDTLSYLPDDILTKVDRASMAFSLEARVPLLDHRVVELAFALTTDTHTSDGRGKAVLRNVLSRHVPPSLYERPKQGFGVPIGQWLRGDLRDWGESLLAESALKDKGFFDPAAVRRLWHEHQTGTLNRQYELWMVLTLQHWANHWGASA